ncbi:MAG: hypothetical protein NWQ69_09665, partial [Paracoccaceae bacterium]|nr:hypothetical protein [Paracoccaceae bacterium]
MIGNLGMSDGPDALVPLGGKSGAKSQAKGDAGPDSGRGWQSALDKADGSARDTASEVISDKDSGGEVAAVGASAPQLPQPIQDMQQKTAVLFQKAMVRNTPVLPDGADTSGAKKAVADLQISASDSAMDTASALDGTGEQSAPGDAGIDASEGANAAKNLKAAVAQPVVLQATVAVQKLAADDPAVADTAPKGEAAPTPT